MMQATLATTRSREDWQADGIISWDILANWDFLANRQQLSREVRSVPPLAIERWQVELLGRIGRLLELPSNWDSYGARPVSRDFLRYALEVLRVIMRPGTPLPALIPTSLGGIQIEWHTRGIDLEIRVQSTSQIHVSYEDQRNGLEGESDLTSDLARLDEFVSELSRRKG